MLFRSVADEVKLRTDIDFDGTTEKDSVGGKTLENEMSGGE